VPDWVPLDAWAGFLEMRQRQRKPPTERAQKLIIETLDQLRSQYDPAELLDQSTRNCWLDVYPLKRCGPSRSQVQHTGFDRLDYKAGMQENEDGSFKL